MSDAERLVAAWCRWAHFGLSALMAALALRELRGPEPWACVVYTLLCGFNLARFGILKRQREVRHERG